MRNIARSFGSVAALRDASLEVRASEIHALAGENGAGKSTLMGILAGLIPPDRGSVHVSGEDVTGWTTAQAIEAKVGMVHQHFMLIPTLTVAENVVLGREPRRGMWLDREGALRATEALAVDSGLEVDPAALVADLPVGIAQRVEILKVLYRGARVLILDEPTAVLSPVEVRQLFGVLRRLRDKKTAIVIITHKLDEVMEIADRITVIRRGETEPPVATRDTSPAALARAMVGRDVALYGEDRSAPPARRDDGPLNAPRLRVSGLVARDARGNTAVRGVDFEVRPGEILGIAGVEGNGQTELIEALTGLRRAQAGRVEIDGASVASLSVRQRVAQGLAHIPEDRHQRGLVLDYSVADNLILGRQRQYAPRGIFNRQKIADFTERCVRDYDIRPADASLPARALSGGNQQKIVVARELRHPFSVLIAAQPTRGVDVGAIAFIHERMRAAKADHKAILLVSADLSELLALSDRVAVIYRGRLVVTLPRGEADAETVGAYMMGADASMGEPA